ncbi:MAG: neuraminidase-like domain-containing protein [Bacteroidia bacterium]|nr:neuraminidase-like domain-containing protein [Bacteroidia bacterium]
MATIRTQKFSVSGVITDANGFFVEEAQVELFLVNLRATVSLGEASTDEAGAYRIAYSKPQGLEAAGIRIVVRPARGGRDLAQSPVLYKAPQHATINLSLPVENTVRGDFSRLINRMQPLLGQIRLTELREDKNQRDISELSAATGEPLARIARLRRAHQLDEATRIDAELYFAWMEAGLPDDPGRLAVQPSEYLESILQAAARRGLIGDRGEEGWKRAIANLKGRLMTQPVALLESQNLFSTVADLSGPDAEYVNRLLSQHLERTILENMPEVAPATRLAVERLLLDGLGDANPDVELGVILKDDLPLDNFDPSTPGAGLSPTPYPPFPPDEPCKLQRHAAYRTTSRSLLSLDTPLVEHPLLAEPIRRAKTFVYAQAAGVNTRKTVKLAERGLTADEWSEDTLADAIKDGIITKAEADALSRIGTLSRIIGIHPDLVGLLNNTAPRELAKLAEYTANDWALLIERNRVALPPRIADAQTYAKTLEDRFEQAYPLPYFVHRRLQQQAANSSLRKFHNQNPSGDWATFDWLKGDLKTFKWTGISADARKGVVAQLAADQRILRLAGPADALQLRGAGFDSALKIVKGGWQTFRDTSGLTEASARNVYTRAQASSVRALHTFAAIRDFDRGGFSEIRFGNVAPKEIADLRKIEGMSELLSAGQYCDCADCRSVLSPAAYLVDMLGFVEEKIKITAPEYQSFQLLQRRPDLATLPLTCANTKTRIPYLTVVNEVLAAWIQQQGQPNPLEWAAGANISPDFLLPVNLPLARLRMYLSHFKLTIFDLVAALRNSSNMEGLADPNWRKFLPLDDADSQLITTSSSDAAVVSKRYGVGTIADLTPQVFIRAAGITRKELSDLVDMRYYAGLISLSVKLVDNPATDDVQAYVEQFQGMTPALADYLYRFIRLWRKTSWTITELDALLKTLSTTATSGQITTDLLIRLSKSAWVQNRYKWTVAELRAFLDQMPASKDYPKKVENLDDRGLLERVFDLEAIFGLKPDGTYQEQVAFDPADFATPAPAASTLKLASLLAGALKISGPELQAILASIEANEANWLGLDLTSLSQLYRHVKIARSLDWDVAEWLHASAMLSMKDPKGLTNLIKLHDFSQLQHALGLLPSEMAFFLRRTDKLDGQDFSFQTDKLTETLKKIADAAGSNDPDKRDKWKAAFQSAVPKIQAQLNVGPDLWASLLYWTPEDISRFWDVNEQDNLTLVVLTGWLKDAERALWLMQRMGWTEQAFAWLSANPGKVKIANRRAKNLNTLKGLAAWKQLMPADPEAAASALAVLEANSDDSSWANYWKLEPAQVKAIRELLGLNAALDVPEVNQLQQTLALSKRLGATAAVLSELLRHDTYAEASVAADIARQLISAQYPDEKERQAILERYDDKVSGLTRDILVQLILTQLGNGPTPFENESSLFAYFLLDIEMEGCFRTSRIVAAHSSIQLYIHRILMNLEQSSDGILKVLDTIEDLEEFKTEWEWRKNYRVWEANRKVFLYPENYLEPDLRDNKTPIFRELEEELLQAEPDQAGAELAWRNYFEKYTELAALRIAGAFFQAEKNTYHFFGRTAKSPFQYYYRRWENQQLWTPWEAMDVAISAEEVTGIVYNGHTYVFWAETEEDAELQKVFLNLSHLKANKRWSTPQRLEYANSSSNANSQVFPSIADNFSFSLSDADKNVLKHLDLTSFSLEDSSYPAPYASGIRLLMSSFIDRSTCQDEAPHALNTQITDLALTESQIDDALRGGKSISSSFIQLTKKNENVSISLSHVGGTRNSAILTLDGQRYLSIVRPEIPQISDGGWKSPTSMLPIAFRMLTTSTGQNGLYSFLLHVIGNNPKIDYDYILSQQGIKQFIDTSTQKIREQNFPLELLGFLLRVQPKFSDDDSMYIKGPYGDYLRELFFHIPFCIAHQMNANQRFEEAKWWYERIFDPTASGDVGDIDRPWRYIEFRELGYAKMKDTLQDTAALERYRMDPFNPHAIARLRISAYQKTIVMKYVDNLVDWGDSLFARYEMENINEALMLYQLAADILGDRPTQTGPCPEPEEASALTYKQIRSQSNSTWDQVLILLENLEPAGAEEAEDSMIPASMPNPQSQLTTLAFCIPANAELQKYWDRVADRLYKIRHCLDLDGRPRQVALFAPPIDPMLLVRAKAMGLSLDEILEILNAPVPHYRFTYLIERAKQYAQMVQSFGSALLAALNSKDTEQLTLLRSVQEREVLRMGREVRKRALEEAQAQEKAATESKLNVGKREKYFSDLYDNGEISQEKKAALFKDAATVLHATAALFNVIEAYLALKAKERVAAGAKGFDSLGQGASLAADWFERRAIKVRRKQDWKFQRDTAAQEQKQLAQQLLAAVIRVDIATKDLQLHERSMEHADEVYTFYRDKFTNLGLYNYMSRVLHTLHRQAYNIAYEAARQAEKACNFEQDFPDSEIVILPDNWDGGRAGLLSGERLLLQLQELERKYHEANRREFELTKHVSLQQLNPLALLLLRVTGKCDFSIPEELYDLDFPGHYRRRIKSVSITIPCIAGPYTTVSATLRLEKSYIRKDQDKVDLSDASVPVMSNVATSSAQNDSGVFELSFRDERYLPFEGAGASGDWKLEMMTDPKLRQFDYNTISDVIVHVRYTAREGGSTLRDDVQAGLKDLLNELKISSSANGTGLFRLFDLRHDFPNEWNKMLKSPGKTLTIKLEASRFPYLAQLASPEIEALTLYTVDGSLNQPQVNNDLGMNQYEILPKRDIDEDLTITFDQLPAQGYLLIRYTLKP